MKKAKTLEELVKKYLDGKPTVSKTLSFDEYKHRNGLSDAKSYSDAVGSLYASAKKNSANYGTNNRVINNKGLQNSGYSQYIDTALKKKFRTDLANLKDTYKQKDASARSSYAGYLETQLDKQNRVKDNVMSHLVDNDVVDINTAVAYGMSAGLSEEDALLIGRTAYEVTKQKVLNSILEQTASLGLDKDGAKLLAIKMGISENDADELAEEVAEMLRYYQNISEDYLEFLEQRSN